MLISEDHFHSLNPPNDAVLEGKSDGPNVENRSAVCWIRCKRTLPACSLHLSLLVSDPKSRNILSDEGSVIHSRIVRGSSGFEVPALPREQQTKAESHRDCALRAELPPSRLELELELELQLEQSSTPGSSSGCKREFTLGSDVDPLGCGWSQTSLAAPVKNDGRDNGSKRNRGFVGRREAEQGRGWSVSHSKKLSKGK